MTAIIKPETGNDSQEPRDDIQIVDDAITHEARSVVPAPEQERLVPFLCLGIVSWLAIIATATLLTF